MLPGGGMGMLGVVWLVRESVPGDVPSPVSMPHSLLFWQSCSPLPSVPGLNSCPFTLARVGLTGMQWGVPGLQAAKAGVTAHSAIVAAATVRITLDVIERLLVSERPGLRGRTEALWFRSSINKCRKPPLLRAGSHLGRHCRAR